MGELGLAATFLLSSRARQHRSFCSGTELRGIPVRLWPADCWRHHSADVSGGSHTSPAEKIATGGAGATVVRNPFSIAVCNQLRPSNCPPLPLRRDPPLGVSGNVRDCGN